MKDANRKLVLLIVLLFFISGVATLPRFGIAWDEGLGNIFFGQRYLFYLTSFNRHYLDFAVNLPPAEKGTADFDRSPYREVPHEFPALADIFAAAGMHLFSQTLPLLDPVDAFHLFGVIAAAVLLWLLYVYFMPHIGATAALMAVIFLATFPRLWGDMHFNVKDVPEMVLITLVIMAYFSWYRSPRMRMAILTGVAFGAALGVKANALFVPPMLLLALWPWPFSRRGLKACLDHIRGTWSQYLLMLLASAVTYILSWPYLYANPLLLTKYFGYIFGQGGREGSGDWSWKPLGLVLSTMPEVMLLFFALGLIAVCRRAFGRREPSDPVWRLLIVWCVLPIVRVALPAAVNFDGIRHFLEFLPAAALIAGCGAAAVIERPARRNAKRQGLLLSGILAAICLNQADVVCRFYPYHHIYFNRLIGGLAGAKRIFGPGEATDYWAVTYRDGMRWLNQNGVTEAYVFAPVADWLIPLEKPLWLRPDLREVTRASVGMLAGAPGPVYTMTITRPGFYERFARYCVEKSKPVFQIVADEVPIMQICFSRNSRKLWALAERWEQRKAQ